MPQKALTVATQVEDTVDKAPRPPKTRNPSVLNRSSILGLSSEADSGGSSDLDRTQQQPLAVVSSSYKKFPATEDWSQDEDDSMALEPQQSPMAAPRCAMLPHEQAAAAAVKLLGGQAAEKRSARRPSLLRDRVECSDEAVRRGVAIKERTAQAVKAFEEHVDPQFAPSSPFKKPGEATRRVLASQNVRHSEGDGLSTAEGSASNARDAAAAIKPSRFSVS